MEGGRFRRPATPKPPTPEAFRELTVCVAPSAPVGAWPHQELLRDTFQCTIHRLVLSEQALGMLARMSYVAHESAVVALDRCTTAKCRIHVAEVALEALGLRVSGSSSRSHLDLHLDAVEEYVVNAPVDARATWEFVVKGDIECRPGPIRINTAVADAFNHGEVTSLEAISLHGIVGGLSEAIVARG